MPVEVNSYKSKVYHPRNPASSDLWNLLDKHYDDFELNYEQKFEKTYGFFRPVIKDVVFEYLSCGDLENGFARVQCKDCKHEYLLAFSCRSRWFCPSCHAKKVVQFGELIKDSILYPVPHRQYVFTIPILLRIYFKYNRKLLTKLSHCAYQSLIEFLRTTTGLKNGVPGAVAAIQTFGDYPDRFHPHIHIIATDGVFQANGMFYVMPRVSIKPLMEIFRTKVFKMLKKEGLITEQQINMLMKWRHSGFSVHNKVRIKRNDEKGQESLGQYIIRNTFSVEKMTFHEEEGTVSYKGKDGEKEFQAEDFIAGITQHIPDKSFQLVRYYGRYSNRTRGDLKKKGLEGQAADIEEAKDSVEIIDVSDYSPKKVTTKTWRECIKKIWSDPLICPRCEGEMRIIAFITQPEIIKKILVHIGHKKENLSRAPPKSSEPPYQKTTYEPFDDGWSQYEEPSVSYN